MSRAAEPNPVEAVEGGDADRHQTAAVPGSPLGRVMVFVIRFRACGWHKEELKTLFGVE